VGKGNPGNSNSKRKKSSEKNLETGRFGPGDYETPKMKNKEKNDEQHQISEKEKGYLLDKTQEDTLDLDFKKDSQSPLMTREEKSELEHFLDETTKAHLSQISAKSLQELSKHESHQKQSPRSEILKEKIIPPDVQKGTNDEAMSFGKSESRSSVADQDEEEYNYSNNNNNQEIKSEVVSVDSRGNPKKMVNEIISRAIQMSDDGFETVEIEPLTENADPRKENDDYYDILSSQDVRFEDEVTGSKSNFANFPLTISRIDIRNSRLVNITEETSQPATSNRENIFVGDSIRSFRPHPVEEEQENESNSNSSDPPVNLQQAKSTVSISVMNPESGAASSTQIQTNNEENKIAFPENNQVETEMKTSILGSENVSSRHQQTEPVIFEGENERISKEVKDVEIDIQGPSLNNVLEKNTSIEKGAEIQFKTPQKNKIQNQINQDPITKYLSEELKKSNLIMTAEEIPEKEVKTGEKKKLTKKDLEEISRETSKEINDLFNIYLETSTKKKRDSSAPQKRYSPDRRFDHTTKLIQSYYINDKSYDATQIPQEKLFNNSQSQSYNYMRFSNFTRYHNLTNSKIKDSDEFYYIATSEGDYDNLAPINERKYRECHVEGVRNFDSEADESLGSLEDPSSSSNIFDRLLNRYMKAGQSPPKGSTMFEKNYEEYSRSIPEMQNPEISAISNNSLQKSNIVDQSLLAITQKDLYPGQKITSTTAGSEYRPEQKNPHLEDIDTSRILQQEYSINSKYSPSSIHNKMYVPKFGTPSSVAEPVQEASEVDGRSCPVFFSNGIQYNQTPLISKPNNGSSFKKTNDEKLIAERNQIIEQIKHEAKSYNPQFLSTQKSNSFPESSYYSPINKSPQKLEEIKEEEQTTYKKPLSKGFTFLDQIDPAKTISKVPAMLNPDYRTEDDIIQPPTLGAQKAFKGTPKKFDSKYLFSSPSRKNSN